MPAPGSRTASCTSARHSSASATTRSIARPRFLRTSQREPRRSGADLSLAEVGAPAVDDPLLELRSSFVGRRRDTSRPLQPVGRVIAWASVFRVARGAMRERSGSLCYRSDRGRRDQRRDNRRPSHRFRPKKLTTIQDARQSTPREAGPSKQGLLRPVKRFAHSGGQAVEVATTQDRWR